MIACAQDRSNKRDRLLIRGEFRHRPRHVHGPTLEAASDVANDPVKEGAKAGHATGPDRLQGAALAEALDEDLLHGVVEIVAQSGVAPAGGKVGADDAEVAASQFFAVRGAASGGGVDDGPAS